MPWGERGLSNWIFFLVFCCSNVLVHWFRLHRFAPYVRPLFVAHSKMGQQLSTIFTFSFKCSLASLPRHVSESTNFLTQVVPLLTSGIGGKIYRFTVVPDLHRFGTSGFFQSFLWLTYNEFFSMTHPWSAVSPVDTVIFLLIIFSLSPSTEI